MSPKDSPAPVTPLAKPVDVELSLTLTVDPTNVTIEQTVEQTTEKIIEGVVALVVQELQSKFSESEAFDLLDAVKVAMLFVEKQPIKGEQQRTVVVDALNAFVTRSNLPVSIKDYYNNMINTGTVAKTIDLIIAATKGQLDLNKPENQQEIAQVASNCLVACLMSCLGGGRKKASNAI